MTPDEGILSDKTPYSHFVQVQLGNGSLLPMANTKNLRIQTRHGLLKLNSFLQVPQLKRNLLSIHRLCHENNYHI